MLNYASNAVSSPDRLRLMYIVGKLTDLEYSLRATAKATKAQKLWASRQRSGPSACVPCWLKFKRN